MHPRFLYDLDDCAILGALDEVGDGWTLKILREAIYGLTRFDDFARALGGGRGVLSVRLKAMTTAGLMERQAYAEPGQRGRFEYHLTEKGLDIYSLEVPNAFALIKILPSLRSGRHGRWAEVKTLAGQEVTVETRRPRSVNADGEIVTRTPAHFRVRPGAVNIYAPPFV